MGEGVGVGDGITVGAAAGEGVLDAGPLAREGDSEPKTADDAAPFAGKHPASANIVNKQMAIMKTNFMRTGRLLSDRYTWIVIDPARSVNATARDAWNDA